jgi:uncharacterized phage-like protein YoqJ
MKILGVTGHRNFYHPEDKIINLVCSYLLDEKVERVLIGGALGFDQLVAKCCISLSIPFEVIIPFEGQELKWSLAQQKEFLEMLLKADKIVLVSEGGVENWKYHKRNAYIVDNSESMLCYLTEDKGGTYSCCQYATSKNKTIVNVINLL